MFDASERLVVCNSQYFKMYGLTEDDVKQASRCPKCWRAASKRAPSRAIHINTAKNSLTEVGRGKATTHEVKSTGGRMLLVMNHPMKGGGWRRLDRHPRGRDGTPAGRTATHDDGAAGTAPLGHRKRHIGIPQARRNAASDGGR
ncbi:MAG: PAS-domain containing protein [Pseudolabrys sp.]